jgi:enoyl-CoA hydratase/carnithine racemase
MSAYLTEPWKKLVLSQAGACLTVTLSNPERRNAIGPEMVGELLAVLAEATRDASVKVIVLTGAGKTFCAGGDFGQMSGLAGDAPRHQGDYADLLLALWRTQKPVIAKVNGHALGGGLGLVAASTLAVAADSALLGTPEVEVGLFPMMIMAVLSRLMPRRRMVEMMLLGQKLSAAEAKEAGLVGQVVPLADLDKAVGDLADKLASKSASTLRLGLQALVDQDERDLETSLPMLKERLATCLATHDAQEGLMAFLEKRSPRWTDS